MIAERRHDRRCARPRPSNTAATGLLGDSRPDSSTLASRTKFQEKRSSLAERLELLVDLIDGQGVATTALRLALDVAKRSRGPAPTKGLERAISVGALTRPCSAVQRRPITAERTVPIGRCLVDLEHSHPVQPFGFLLLAGTLGAQAPHHDDRRASG